MNYEKHLQKIRWKIFEYPENIQEKADRVLRKLKENTLKNRPHSKDYHPFYACE